YVPYLKQLSFPTRRSSDLDLNLVKSQKLLGAGAFPYVLKDYSLLILQGNPSQGQSLEDVQALLLAEIEKLRKGEFSDELITSIIDRKSTRLNSSHVKISYA